MKLLTQYTSSGWTEHLNSPLKAFFFAETGIMMRNPIAFAVIHRTAECKPSQSKIRFDAIILRMQKRKAFWNKVIVGVLTLLTGLVLLFGLLIVSVFLPSQHIFWLGIIVGQLTFMANLLFRDRFECDYYRLPVTHKGKTYC